MLREKIRDDIAKVLKSTDYGLQTTDKSIEVTRTSDPKFGDYTTNVALRRFAPQVKPSTDRKTKQSPLDFANILADSLQSLPYVEKLEVAGPGFINFFVKPEIWQKEVESLLTTRHSGKRSGKAGERIQNRFWTLRQHSGQASQNDKSGKKILVEYAHPNTHKLFHIGHLRNITTGEAICRLLEALGDKVVRVNYQGDVGLHIAKALWGVKNLGGKQPKSLDEKAEFLSRAYIEGHKAYEEGGQKEEIDEINKKLYEGDSQLTKIWQQTRQWSLDYFERIYRRVGTRFYRLYFEGEVAESGKQEVLKFVKKGVFVESEGAIIFPGDKFGLHKRVFVSSRGFATYEAKDVGLVKLQLKEYSPDLIIHVVAPEQTDYFKVLFKALEQVYPETRGKELHLVYGWVRLKEGKMSSRKGEVITGEWLLDEAKRKAREILVSSEVKKNVDIDEVCEQVAVGAVKYAFLKMGLSQDLVFDLAQAVNLNGNSGPYLQYTHARCRSVLARDKGTKGAKRAEGEFEKMDPEEDLLLRALGHFEEVILDAANAYAPNLVANYLYEVAQKYNTFYNNLPILKASEAERSRRLFLTEATADVLQKGLYLLGISAPEKM